MKLNFKLKYNGVVPNNTPAFIEKFNVYLENAFFPNYIGELLVCYRLSYRPKNVAIFRSNILKIRFKFNFKKILYMNDREFLEEILNKEFKNKYKLFKERLNEPSI